MTEDAVPMAFCEECRKLTGDRVEVSVLDFAAMREHLQRLHQDPPDIEINVSPTGEIGFRWGEGL